MSFIFLIALTFAHLIYSSDYKLVDIAEEKKPIILLKKIDQDKDNLDLGYKKIEVRDNQIFEKRNIVKDVQWLIGDINRNYCQEYSYFASCIAGITSGALIPCYFIASNFISSERFLPDLLINCTQALLHFSGGSYFFGTIDVKKEREIKEFIENLFDSVCLENKEFLSKEQINIIHQKIIDKITQKYAQTNSKTKIKKILCKILPIVHSSVALGLSFFPLNDGTVKDDPVGYVAQWLNICVSAVPLISYISSFMFCNNNVSDKIENMSQKLLSLLQQHQHEYCDDFV